MAISKNWLNMVRKKFLRSSDSTDTILPDSIAASSRFSSQKADTPKEDITEVRTFGVGESVAGATGFKKKRQRMLQNLIKIVPTRSSRKSQRDTFRPNGNTCPRNSTEKAISKEETTFDIEGDPHEAASSLLSSVHERDESTKKEVAAIRIQAVFRAHRVRQTFLASESKASSSERKRMGMSQYCCSSTVQRSFCSSHREIISANNSTCPSSSCTKEAIVKGEMAINVKGPINGAVSSTPLQNEDQTQEDVGAIKIQAIFRGHRARRASSKRKENARRTMRMSQNLFNRVRRKFHRTSHRGIIDTITTEETAAIFENAIGGASSIPSISRKKDVTKDDIAAIKIQAFFRGHHARRAFLALRSLVKLQAVVRGVCVRRQARVALHCMHALARLQVSVRARQLLNSDQELS